MKHYYKKIFLFAVFVFAIGIAKAQCDISTFTATAVNGSCTQDGAIQVAIPGASGCANVTATLIKDGDQIDFISLSSSGTGQFNNLAPGNYSVQVQQGATTIAPKPVTVTTSYNLLNVTATATGVSCPATAPGYSADGTVTVTFSGGNGPYRITLTGPGGPYIFDTPTPATHVFTGLAPGNYNAEVRDLSAACTSAEVRAASVATSGWLPLEYYMGRRKIKAGTCEFFFQIDISKGNFAATQIPGNATYTINGVTKNLIPNSPNGSVYTFRTEYGIPANADITWNITDGCTSVFDTMKTGNIVQQVNDQFKQIVTNSSCESVFEYVYYTYTNRLGANVSAQGRSYLWFNFADTGGKVSYYYESPVDSDNWVFIETLPYNSEMGTSANTHNWKTSHLNTRIKLVLFDDSGCNTFEHIVDNRSAQPVNNISRMRPVEVSGVLEGTSSFTLTNNGAPMWANSFSFNFPLTYEITRADGQSSMTITPSQPHSLAGSYTINFPYIYSYTPPNPISNNLAGMAPTFGDLPLGEYNIKITDACGYSETKTINLTKPAGYNPTVTYEVGCAASNVVYNMGQNANTQPYGRVYLYINNGGTPGTLVQGYNNNQLLNGKFNTVPPGNYLLVFRNINYTDRIMQVNTFQSTLSTRSVARNVTGLDQEYMVPIMVEPYKQVTFSSVSLFCDNNDPSTGILALTAQGIPVGFIRYDVWAAGANPDTDAPLQTYTTTNLTEMEHVFTNLNEATYIVRITTDCGFTQQNITLVRGATVIPEAVSNPPKVCPGGEVTLAIPLPSPLFDMYWTDDAGNTVGTGNKVTVSPTAETTYTIHYALKPAFNCTDPMSGTKEITVGVFDTPVTEVSRSTECSTDGTTYTLTVEVNGEAPFTVVGSGAPGTWAGNVWTSGAIDIANGYYVAFQTVDADCTKMEISGDAPNCSSGCFKPAVTTGNSLETKHGITALGRAGAQNSDQWPMVRKGAWTVLEAKTKGFVVNRLTDAQMNAIPAANLVEGMMIYNITQQCLMINIDGTASGWKCYGTPACPD